MPRLNANLSMMFNEVPYLDRFAAAAKAGFKAVEFLFPYDFSKEQVKAALDGSGLKQAERRSRPGRAATPAPPLHAVTPDAYAASSGSQDISRPRWERERPASPTRPRYLSSHRHDSDVIATVWQVNASILNAAVVITCQVGRGEPTSRQVRVDAHEDPALRA